MPEIILEKQDVQFDFPLWYDNIGVSPKYLDEPFASLLANLKYPAGVRLWQWKRAKINESDYVDVINNVYYPDNDGKKKMAPSSLVFNCRLINNKFYYESIFQSEQKIYEINSDDINNNKVIRLDFDSIGLYNAVDGLIILNCESCVEFNPNYLNKDKIKIGVYPTMTQSERMLNGIIKSPNYTWVRSGNTWNYTYDYYLVPFEGFAFIRQPRYFIENSLTNIKQYEGLIVYLNDENYPPNKSVSIILNKELSDVKMLTKVYKFTWCWKRNVTPSLRIDLDFPYAFGCQVLSFIDEMNITVVSLPTRLPTENEQIGALYIEEII